MGIVDFASSPKIGIDVTGDLGAVPVVRARAHLSEKLLETFANALAGPDALHLPALTAQVQYGPTGWSLGSSRRACHKQKKQGREKSRWFDCHLNHHELVFSEHEESTCVDVITL
jgi:hypothetical protein